MGVGSDDIVATIYGVDPQYITDLSLKLTAGDYNNGNSACLVGSMFANDHNIKVGSRISIGRDSEIGILNVTGTIEELEMSFDLSTDSVIVVTQEWFDNTYDRNDYDHVASRQTRGKIRRGVRTTIEKRMNTRDKIVNATGSKATLVSIYATFGTITPFVSAIGGIVMIVAGVSIFNIMMMSVSERIIGTHKKEVMSIFIY
ncbi:MAG: hypothetical protein WCF90_05280 [Methanomicrobiales archaeon]